MKKLVVITLLMATILSGCNNTTSDTLTTNQIEAEIERVAAILDNTGETLEPIRPIDSENTIYVEGIESKDANRIDALFRHLEEHPKGSSQIDAKDDEFAWICTEIDRQKLSKCFDPQFNLTEQFQATTSKQLTTGAMSWLTRPLNDRLDVDAEDFHFIYDTDLKAWRMSAGYLLMSFAYAAA